MDSIQISRFTNQADILELLKNEFHDEERLQSARAFIDFQLTCQKQEKEFNASETKAIIREIVYQGQE